MMEIVAPTDKYAYSSFSNALASSSYNKLCKVQEIRTTDTIYSQSSSQKLFIATSRLNFDRIQIKLVSISNLKPIKKTKIFVGDNSESYRMVLKTNLATSSLLFYHEASLEIRIIKELALITRRTFHLQKLCDAIGIGHQIHEIKKNIDLEFSPSLSCLIVSFGTCIGLIYPREETPKIIYNTKNDQIRSIHYDDKEKLLLALGSQTLSLFTLDSKGVIGSRSYTNNFLRMDCRVIGWDSIEKAIVIAQLNARKKENLHFLGYCNNKIEQLTSVLNKPRNASSYCCRRKSLLYVDDDCDSSKGKLIRSFPVNRADCNEEAGECMIEGEKLAYFPKNIGQVQIISLGSEKDVIFVKPFL